MLDFHSAASVMPNDSQPEIITMNREVLQSQIRDVLPSQNGFGSELQASNVITPIIDLTAAAEGSGLPVSLHQAIAFGSQSAFSVENTTTVFPRAPGCLLSTSDAAADPLRVDIGGRPLLKNNKKTYHK